MHPWAKVAVACPKCGHRFEREEGYWLGAVLINTVAAVGVFAGLFVTLTVATWPDVPWNTVLVVTLVVNVVFPVLFYPWARMLWVAIDLAVRPVEGEPN
ncbi:MAG: DUF983 domain-containing protein [Acidimicrobiia bacterium]|nr:DUF983 domain-containing protein [Acidimicrobiia bacterium]